MIKYIWYRTSNDEPDYTVAHQEDGKETFICNTDKSEKAHFIAAACNQFKDADQQSQEIEQTKEAGQMTPRFEVIADYPSQCFMIGDIIIGERAYLIAGEDLSEKHSMADYPALFKRITEK